MVAQERVGFRPPLTTILPVAVVLVLLGLIFPSDGTWGFVVVFLTVFGVLRMRQLTVLTDEHVEVTVVRTRRIPWADIEGFEAGSGMRGGTIVHTSGGDVHAISPCSWWGGPASPADLETLARMLASRARRR